jgi:hypothetical protein
MGLYSSTLYFWQEAKVLHILSKYGYFADETKVTAGSMKEVMQKSMEYS